MELTDTAIYSIKPQNILDKLILASAKASKEAVLLIDVIELIIALDPERRYEHKIKELVRTRSVNWLTNIMLWRIVNLLYLQKKGIIQRERSIVSSVIELPT